MVSILIHFMEWEWYNLDSSEVVSIIEMLILQPGPLINSSLRKKEDQVYLISWVYIAAWGIILDKWLNNTMGPTTDGAFRKFILTGWSHLCAQWQSNGWLEKEMGH